MEIKPSMSNKFDERCEVRQHLLMPARIHSEFSTKVQISVTDLSLNGCRIQVNANYFSNNQLVFIRLDQFEPLRATIRWRSFQVGGLEFDRPLYLPIFEHLAKQWQWASSAGTWQRPSSDAADAEPLTSDRMSGLLTNDDGMRSPAVLVKKPGLGYRLRYR